MEVRKEKGCSMDQKKITSVGGRKFTVEQDGDQTSLAWKDIVTPGSDALFTREDATALGLELIRAAQSELLDRKTVDAIAHLIEMRALADVRPDTPAYDTYFRVSGLLLGLLGKS
jgi:hypothetical protein